MSIDTSSEATFIEEEEEESNEWEVLVNHPDYEINVNYPHQIRNISTGRIVKESMNKDGYLRVYLNGKHYYKHRIIALQFIPNPDNLPQIDHINGLRSDNHINNLRWVSNKQNANNKHTYGDREVEYVQELPDNAVVVENYSRFEFEGIYFHGGLFYVDTGNGDYRINIFVFKFKCFTLKICSNEKSCEIRSPIWGVFLVKIRGFN